MAFGIKYVGNDEKGIKQGRSLVDRPIGRLLLPNSGVCAGSCANHIKLYVHTSTLSSPISQLRGSNPDKARRPLITPPFITPFSYRNHLWPSLLGDDHGLV